MDQPARPPIPSGLDLEREIDRLRRQRNAVLLAHYYQEEEIQDLADFLGDSLQLAQAARDTAADVIVFCGVHFMAETAKVLNPSRTVIIPDLDAGCSLAEGCPADRFRAWKARYPGAVTVSYVNCSAAVKAESDLICTSSNAERIVAAIPEDRTILFAPDRNLGRYLVRKTGRSMELWPGSCIVHETFSLKKLLQLKERHPGAEVLAHPECEEPVLEVADFVGSTSALLARSKRSPATTFIVATEPGILVRMRAESPDKTFVPAPPEGTCACNECPFMKLTTLEKLYLALQDLQPVVDVPAPLRERARRPIERMLAITEGRAATYDEAVALVP